MNLPTDRRLRFGRIATATLLASALLYGYGCSDDSGGEPGPSRPDIAGAVYVGAATDEGLLAVLSASPKERPASTPVITAPETGAVLEVPTTFAYRIGATAEGRAPSQRERGRSVRVDKLMQLFGPERRAHAHGEPMNGPAFLLTFSTSSDPALLRVFTQEVEYIPGTAEWQTLAAIGEEITLVVTLAIFDQGRITQDGGPFRSAPLSFRVRQ